MNTVLQQDYLVLPTELIILSNHRKGFIKLTLRALALRQG